MATRFREVFWVMAHAHKLGVSQDLSRFQKTIGAAAWDRAENLPVDECKKVRIDDIRMRSTHAMREFLVDLQCTVL